MKFWFGLAIGVTLGAGGTYLGLRHVQTPPVVGAEQIASGSVDAGVTPTKPHRRRAGAGRDVSPAGDAVVVLTDADRALEWRGDVVALPPMRLDVGGEGSSRSLNDGEIQQAIADGAKPIVACIQRTVGDVTMVAEVTAQILVGGDGRAQKLRVRAPVYLHRRELIGCLRRAIWDLRFPPTGAPTIVTAPFHVE